ncbi:GGDEF domain-containing protein [Marispirochaeta sp.]|jgi:diguanylate cyclase (GGDEF)-like protein|uniref:GGDEF domain-containing protein n=1 Tax=Marispirochaeta sp. TaxID=2038653 RepID=UPI0029C70516|nr:GGDEF domain-containing protein [Marispirochaeta sp.]
MKETKQNYPDDPSYFFHRLESNVFLYKRILFILGISSIGFLVRNLLYFYSVYDIAKYYLYIYIIGCISIFPIRMTISSLYKHQKYKAVNRLIIISAFIIFILLVLISVLDSTRIKVNEPVNDYNFSGYILGLFIAGFVLRLEWKVSLVIYMSGIVTFISLYYIFSPRIFSIQSVLPFVAVNFLALYFSYSREKFYLILYLDKTTLLQQTWKDSLTESFNRRYMKRVIQQNFVHKRGMDTPFSCIFTDIDFFKEVNDKYGHDTGDVIIIDFSNALQKESRNMDLVIRYGGEEFLIILPNTHLKEAKGIAERIRHVIEDSYFSDNKIRITASFGVTEANDDDTEETIIRRVDSLLYKAKKEGRNRCCLG